MESVKSYRLIEHSIILSPDILARLKEIAFKHGNGFTYSQIVAFLVKYYYYESQNQNQNQSQKRTYL